MYSAVVLLCMMGTAQIDNCLVIISPVPIETEVACINELYESYKNGKFSRLIQGRQFEATQMRCVEWKKPEVETEIPEKFYIPNS